jgi:hypothetical protein
MFGVVEWILYLYTMQTKQHNPTAKTRLTCYTHATSTDTRTVEREGKQRRSSKSIGLTLAAKTGKANRIVRCMHAADVMPDVFMRIAFEARKEEAKQQRKEERKADRRSKR